MSEDSAFQKSRVTPPAPRCQCCKSLLLPGHLILLAPIERDLSQGPGAICVPRCLDSVPTKRVLEPSEDPPTMNSRNKVSANGVGFHRTREVLHDCPLAHLKLRRQFQEAHVETIRLATGHSCFCQTGRSGSSLVSSASRRSSLASRRSSLETVSTWPVSGSKKEEDSSSCISRASMISLRRTVTGMLRRSF